MKSIARFGDRCVGLGIAALVLFTPLAFGSVETWAIVALESAIFAIAGLWLLVRASGYLPWRESDEELLQDEVPNPSGRQRRAGRGWTGLELPILLFGLFALFQIAPLSRGLVSVVSPRVSALYERTVPGYGAGRGPVRELEEWLLSRARNGEMAGPGSGGGKVPVPLSYAPDETRKRLLLFAAYVALFFVVVDRYSSRPRFRRLILWIVFVGVGIAIEGIFQKLAWNGKILWFRSPGTVSRPFGPFVNSNHFAGYMELIVPLALGLLLTLIWDRSSAGAHASLRGAEAGGSGGDPLADSGPEMSWGARFVPAGAGNSWTERSRWPKAILLGFLLALSIASIVLSLSRGGVLATLLTFALFGPLIFRRDSGVPARRGVLIGSIALVVLALGVAFWIGSSALGERAATLTAMSSEPSFMGRFVAWKRSLGVLRDHPIVGIGLGAFETAFAGYYPPGTSATWREAHNDYLQLLVEVGVLGILPALCALFLFFRRHVFPLVRADTHPDRFFNIGLAMAILSMLFHSFVDFNLQVPAVAFLFVLIGGMVVASSSRVAQPPPARTVAGRSQMLLLAGAACMLVLSVFVAVSGTERYAAERMADTLALGKAPVPDPAGFERGMRLGSKLPAVLAELGDSEIAQFDDWLVAPARPAGDGREHLERAGRAYTRLVSLAPIWSWGWWGLGETYARRSALERIEQPTSLERLIPASEEDLGRQAKLSLAALRTSIDLEPNSFQLEDDLAKLYRDEGLRGQALNAYERSAWLMPLYYLHDFPPVPELPEDVYRAIARGMERAAETNTLVDPSEIRQNLGSLAERVGDLPSAEKQFRLGFGVAQSELMQGVLAFELGEALRMQEKAREAMPWLERGTKCPAVAWRSWASLGMLRTASGDHCGARDAYRSAASLVQDEIWPELALAREMAECGDAPGAIVKLRYLIGLYPSSTEARMLLVELLRRTDQRSEALQQARELLATATGDANYKRLVEDLERGELGSEGHAAPP